MTYRQPQPTSSRTRFMGDVRQEVGGHATPASTAARDHFLRDRGGRRQSVTGPLRSSGGVENSGRQAPAFLANFFAVTTRRAVPRRPARRRRPTPRRALRRLPRPRQRPRQACGRWRARVCGQPLQFKNRPRIQKRKVGGCRRRPAVRRTQEEGPTPRCVKAAQLQ